MASMTAKAWDCTFDDAVLERIALPDIEGELLMELFEETGVEVTEDDRLGCLMRSLEAELGHSTGGSGAELGHSDDCEDCVMDDVLSDLEYNSRYTTDDLFDWTEMEVVAAADSQGGGWYVDEERMMGLGDAREYYYFNESCMEQEYMPLWQ